MRIYENKCWGTNRLFEATAVELLLLEILSL